MLMHKGNPKILAFSTYYLPGYKGGGPIKTVANLVSTTSGDFDYYLVCKDRDLGDEKSYPGVFSGRWSKAEGSDIFYCSPRVKGVWQIVLLMLREKYDVVYLNSFFSPVFSLLPLVLSKLTARRIVLGPRGVFSPGALSLKAKKKSVFISAFKVAGLHRNVVFQASSEFEKQDIYRALGDQVDVFVAEDIGLLEESVPVTIKRSDCLRLVFISRISPKKNLLFALQVLQELKCKVAFDIYGPVEDQEYWDECLGVIDNLPDNVVVNYRGELQPKEVVETISRYDLFYMPTKGENYGHVIAEAICAALPVLISDQTPWRNLEEQGIGWDIPLSDPQCYVQAIENAHAMTVDDYSRFRNRVLAWAKDKFENPEAIEANKAMFEYVLKK
ncbi:glycosyltransferase [Halomonas sp. HG01]|uniref:glycosyltransferase n=1 Tax=Halomonas sp. HG01 TaxID=1609967 RepID=UPI0006970C16|nr:glycosyltransferase [Halomonas sp. HG01]